MARKGNTLYMCPNCGYLTSNEKEFRKTRGNCPRCDSPMKVIDRKTGITSEPEKGEEAPNKEE